MAIIFWIIQIIFVPVFAPLCIGIVRKIKAKFQNKVGADIFQPYRDLWKLFHKDEVISEDASWIFRFSPYFIFSITLVLGASIPIITAVFSSTVLGDLLTIVYLIALGTFFLALAGLDTGSSFGGFGSSREMTVAALTEGGLIFSLLAVGFFVHSTNAFIIADTLASASNFSIPIFLAFGAFIVAMLAETARFPFDNPATHLELTMIHEAMILEYSGKRLALMEWAAANKFLVFLILGVNIFFPWGLTSSQDIAGVFLAIGILLLRIFVLCIFVAILESTIAKFRFFRLPDLLFTSFVLSIISIGLIL